MDQHRNLLTESVFLSLELHLGKCWTKGISEGMLHTRQLKMQIFLSPYLMKCDGMAQEFSEKRTTYFTQELVALR